MYNFNEYLLYSLCYLSSSIPWGYLIIKVLKGEDIKKKGSGNIGATNVTRVAGKKLGGIVFFLDFLKAFLPVFLIKQYTDVTEATLAICAILAVIGHILPVWLKFKGGKGVSCALGIVAAISPQIFLLVALSWVLIFYFTRISSLSALISFTMLPFFMYFLYPFDNKFVLLAYLLVVIIIYLTHLSNIARLLNGEEMKIGKK